MKVLCCGDRNWNNKKRIHEFLSEIPSDEFIVILEGECRGADLQCKRVALELGLTVQKFPAEDYGQWPSCGPIRNLAMLDEKPDLVLAFHNDITTSKGTKHTVTIARARNIETMVIQENGIHSHTGAPEDGKT